ncbi:MAG: serine/threonine-protein kinase, partial [Pseudomonadota bacterium]
MSAPPKVPFEDPDIYARYEFIELLGHGGMGQVFRAKDQELQREVAIKTLLNDSLDDEASAKLRNEARIQANLNHPNVVGIFNLIEDDHAIGLVLEYVPGQTLAQAIKTQRADYRQKLVWLIEVSNALAKAHELGIVHCDLKPDNIMISGDGQAKVADFGISSEFLTATNPPVGSPCRCARRSSDGQRRAV